MRVCDGVYRVEGRASNVYLLEAGPTLVDAGTPWDGERIRGLLTEAGVEADDVERVLLTHYDIDHVGTLSSLGLDCPVYVAEPDAGYLAGTTRPPLGELKGLTQRLSGSFLDRPSLPIERVGDRQQVGGFVAHRTPGHTAGHLTWVAEAQGAAFVGDLVRSVGGRLEPAPWYISADSDGIRRSIARLRAREPAVEWLCPGHGPPISGGVNALPSS
ncbi:MAG: MBL fold metallo-hydrolase [Halobacteriaceae archaeon]